MVYFNRWTHRHLHSSSCCGSGSCIALTPSCSCTWRWGSSQCSCTWGRLDRRPCSPPWPQFSEQGYHPCHVHLLWLQEWRKSWWELVSTVHWFQYSSRTFIILKLSKVYGRGFTALTTKNKKYHQRRNDLSVIMQKQSLTWEGGGGGK